MNKQAETQLANMRENCRRDLPWFVGMKPNKREFVIVGGGPSLRDSTAAIRRRQSNGWCIVAANGALRFLRQRGVEPDIAVFIDASPVVADFIERDATCIYLIASCVDPVVLNRLTGRRIVLWHLLNPLIDEGISEILRQYPGKPTVTFGGGSTAPMRCPHLGYALGFREFHFYGIDSCYANDGADHAYTKHDGVEPQALTVHWQDKPYRCSPWMARQAEEFPFYYRQFTELGCRIVVHGTGLIPDIWRSMRGAERRAA